MKHKDVLQSKKALLIIDVQNDFFSGGALPVSEGHKIFPILNELMKLPFDLFIATKDWHPVNHVSFANTHSKKIGDKVIVNDIEQILWPIHCVQNTLGSEFCSGWDTSKINKVIYKGSDIDVDSYSAFFDNQKNKSTGLIDYLKNNDCNTIYVVGVATDYCVKYSVLDALKLGIRTYVITDACSGVNLHSDDSVKALHEMESAGAILVSSSELRSS